MRWLLVPPAAALGFLIAQLSVILVTMFIPDPISRLLSALATPLAFVMLGSRVAPRGKVRVAGILAVVMLVFQGILLAGILSPFKDSQERFELSTALVLGVVGAILGLFLVYNNERLSHFRDGS